MEHELFEYKQAAATLKLGELLDAIHTEIDIRHRSGTLNENGALRQKNDFINELLPRIMVMPKYARRMALVFPTTLSVVTVLYGTWYIWGAIKLA
jgi:hypothetical protein